MSSWCTTTLRRRAHWHSMSSGAGGSDENEEDDGFEEEENDDVDESDEEPDPVKEAHNEAKKRRLQNKLLRVEVAVRDAILDLDMSKAQRKYVLKMFDPSQIEYDKQGRPKGIHKAVKSLVEEFSSEFAGDSGGPKNLPSQGSRHNAQKGARGKNQTEQELRRKYSALRY